MRKVATREWARQGEKSSNEISQTKTTRKKTNYQNEMRCMLCICSAVASILMLAWQQCNHEIIYLIPFTIFFLHMFHLIRKYITHRITHTSSTLNSIRIEAGRNATTFSSRSNNNNNNNNHPPISGGRLIFISNCISLWSIQIKYLSFLQFRPDRVKFFFYRDEHSQWRWKIN